MKFQQITGKLQAVAAGLRAKPRRIATVAVGTLTLFFGYHIVFGHNGLISYGQKRTEAKNLENEVKSLQQENDRMLEHVTRLQNDPGAIEHQAREELHYTRPGEVIYTLPASKIQK